MRAATNWTIQLDRPFEKGQTPAVLAKSYSQLVLDASTMEERQLPTKLYYETAGVQAKGTINQQKGHISTLGMLSHQAPG